MLDPLDGQGLMYRRTATKKELERPLTFVERLIAFFIMILGLAVIWGVSLLVISSLFGFSK